MAEISILSLTTLMVVFSLSVSISNSLQDSVSDDSNVNFFTVSSFRYSKSQVRPYDTRYIRGLFISFPLILLYFMVMMIFTSELCFCAVDLPPWFSSLNVAIESDVDIVSFLLCSLLILIFSPKFDLFLICIFFFSMEQSAKSVSKISKSLLPVICFRDGSPPLPDASTNALKDLGTL